MSTCIHDTELGHGCWMCENEELNLVRAEVARLKEYGKYEAFNAGIEVGREEMTAQLAQAQAELDELRDHPSGIGDADIQRVFRERDEARARVAEMEEHWKALEADLQTAKRHKESPGGIHFGPPDYACIPPGTLNMLLRACRSALSTVPPGARE